MTSTKEGALGNIIQNSGIRGLFTMTLCIHLMGSINSFFTQRDRGNSESGNN